MYGFMLTLRGQFTLEREYSPIIRHQKSHDHCDGQIKLAMVEESSVNKAVQKSHKPSYQWLLSRPFMWLTHSIFI